MPAVPACGPVVGRQLDQFGHLVPEGVEHAHAGEARGERLGELLQPVVPGPDVAALMAQHGRQLPVGQLLEGAGGDHQTGVRAGQRPRLGADVLQHHQPLPAAPGGLDRLGQLRCPARQLGVATVAQRLGRPDLTGERQHRLHPARRQHRGAQPPPALGLLQAVRGLHPVRRAREHQGAQLRQGGGGGEHQPQRAAQQDRHHEALPHQQRQHRFALHPAGPGQQPGHEGREQQSEQQQADQGRHRMGSPSTHGTRQRAPCQPMRWRRPVERLSAGQ